MYGMSSSPGKAYWGKSMISFLKDFLYDEGNSNIFVDGSGSNPGSLASSRYEAGYDYARYYLKELISGLRRDSQGNIIEKLHIVTHSHGSAFGAGMVAAINYYGAMFGVEVSTVIHLSPSGSADFSTPESPMTYQFGIENDPVVDQDVKINGVDYFGEAKSKFDNIVDDYSNNHKTQHLDNQIKYGLLDLRRISENDQRNAPASKDEDQEHVGGCEMPDLKYRDFEWKKLETPE